MNLSRVSFFIICQRLLLLKGGFLYEPLLGFTYHLQD